MKNRILYIFIACLFIASCEKTGTVHHEGAQSGTPIRFGEVKIVDPGTKSDDSCTVTTSTFSDESAGICFTVEEKVEPLYPSQETKAGTITTSNLVDFDVLGLYDKEILDKQGAMDEGVEDVDDLKFIPWATASGSYVSADSKWIGDFADEYDWRFGTHHHFWATPNISSIPDFAVDADDFSKATFSYTSDGTEDIILAYKNQYYGKDEEAASTKNQTLGLTFYHALAALKVNSSGLSFYKRTPGQTDKTALSSEDNIDGQPRCSVLKYEVRNIKNTGDCSVTGSTFSWSNQAVASGTTPIIDLLEDNEARFIIPQNKPSTTDKSIIHLEIVDRKRDLTRPFIFETSSVMENTTWAAGNRYVYNLSGDVIVPVLNGDGTGMDANFSGKPFQSLCVINDIGVKYIQKIRLTWTNHMVLSGATGTNAAVGWEYGTSAPSESEYKTGNSFVLTNPKICWAFKDSRVVKGEPYGAVTPSGTLTYDFDCSMEIDMEDFDISKVISIWCSYMGSDGGHARITWKMTNMKLEVVEWRP